MNAVEPTGAPTALGHLAVADLSDTIAGQYCARLLADLGARVTLVEPPGGSPLRREPPLAPASGKSLVFRHLNAGKRSIVLDRDGPEGERRLAEIVAAADVVVLPPGADEAPLAALNPQAILARIDDFAPGTPHGRWQGPEIVIQALSGMMHSNGAHGREPLYGCGERSAYAAGVAAFIGVLAALFARPALGGGQAVSVDRAETAAAMAFPYVMQFIYSGHDRSRAELSIPAGQVLCRDGWVCIWVYNFRWRALCAALGLEHLAEDPRFAEPETRRRNWDALFAIIQATVAERDAEDLVDVLQAAQVIAAKAPRLSELHANRHLDARGYWRFDGESRALGPPFRLSRTPCRPAAPAPRLGEAAGLAGPAR